MVVYTAITKDYATLKELPDIGSSFNVAFLEDLNLKSSSWTIKPIYNNFSSSNRNAKIHKILSHVYFPSCEYSLWIDGSVKILPSFQISELIDNYLNESDIALFKHSRGCVYEEFKACCYLELDDINIMTQQMEKYRQNGLQPNSGLSECTVLLRRHTPMIQKLNETWWEEIQSGSIRDQLSFDYVVRKLGVNLTYFPGFLPSKNKFFQRIGRKFRYKKNLI